MEQQTASTICENACRQYIERYLKKYQDIFSDYIIPYAEDTLQLIKKEQYLKETLDRLEAIEVEPCCYNAREVSDEYMEKLKDSIESERATIERNHAQELELLKRRHAVLEENARTEASSEVQQVIDKRNTLLKYKDDLRDVFDRYSITPNEVTISDDTTIPELCGLYDSAIHVCETYFKATNNKIFEKLSIPVDELNESEGWIMMFVIALTVTLASPVLLGIYTYKTIRSTSNIYAKLEELKLASSLMYEGDFDRFLDKDKYVVEEEDTTEADEERESALKALTDYDKVQAEFDEYLNTHITEMQQKYNDAYNSVTEMKKSTVRTLRDLYESIHAEVEELKRRYKKFGSEVYEHSYYNREFQIGTVSDVLPLTTEIPLKNIIFEKRDLTDLSILPFVKLMLLNAIMNVKEKHLYVTIVDSTDLGTHFAEFFDQRFPDIVTLETAEVVQALTKIRNEETERIKTLKTSDIDTFNKECEELGKVTLDYKLYILTGDLSRITEDESFLALMRHSARFGVWIWVLGPALPLEECLVYRREPSLREGTLLKYNQELAIQVLNTYAKTYADSADRGILYKKHFADKYIPRDKWWTYSTIKGIDLHFGLVDGDPDKGYPIKLGDAPVHGNMVGTTGAGKSVCINQLLASLFTMYSPNELNVVMIDFKNVEFSFYADQETHSYARVPHCKVLAGTKDGEYALSIFKFLCDEMDRRTAIFSKAGVKNLEEYRTKFPDEIMPRILLLIDEYQVMFTELPDKIVNLIMTAIRSLAKLARFCGCHMLFTSQSMKGTMDKDVQDQFALRVALRCSADTATSVLGDDAPSKLKTKNGYLYTNEDGGNTKDRNRLWRTPFIPTENLEDIISEINKMWGKPITTEFYDESRMYTDSTLQEWYEKYPDVWTDPHVMIVGEKTSYSVNKAPCNFKFNIDDGENLLVFGNSTADTLNVVLTLVDNIQHHANADIMMCSADREAVDIINMPALVIPKSEKMIDPSYPFEDLMDFWERIIEGRKQKARGELKPLYVFCIFYEKKVGYGRNSNPKTSYRFEGIMQEAPGVDVHFIVVLKNKGELMGSSFKKFNHKIVLSCSSDMAYQLGEDDRPAKFPTNPQEGVFGLYLTLGNSFKFKVYQHTFAKPIESNEVFIG